MARLAASTVNVFSVFIEKAEELDGSGFMRRLSGSTVRFRIEGNFASVSTDGPTLDEMKSFSTTLRLFLLGDSVSFRSVAELTDADAGLSAMWRQEFSRIRIELNRMLEATPTIPIAMAPESKGPLSNRDMLDIWLYGDLTHVSQKKRELFKVMASASLLNMIFQSGLQDALLKVVHHVFAAAVEMRKELGR